MSRPERVHLAAVVAEGIGIVAAWDVKVRARMVDGLKSGRWGT